ncbi:DNA polymerase/3'-5' exonuclease PolX [Spirosoma sp. BT702]|uniref:DNA polymerase/3'-5' exonuclease PolX n=1 Tax=Spirosoma profusum TaxID=2771354 RepID=A0A926Y4H2_9BACT|nr:helix-hairpin-helix domain-containing protein [Spirosoma profusum]MBD2703235.1 DNA polymerase/3'-5' exonuclease PolX [Spirosoma profusum]
MTNTEIVDLLELTGRLMELHDRDAFKTRSYQTAAFNLDKSTADLANLPVEELIKLQGVGKSVAQKIREIADTGRLTELDELLAQTPEGVLDMFRIKGLGVKKIRTLWRELGIDNLGELQRAGENGEIAKIKGFGGSTQEKILAALEFLQEQQGKVRMDKAAMIANLLQEELAKHFDRVEISGQVRRKAQEVDRIQLLVQTSDPLSAMLNLNNLPTLTQNEAESSPFIWRGRFMNFDVEVELRLYPAEQMNRQLFIQTAAEPHLQQVGNGGASLLEVAYTSVVSELAEGATEDVEQAIYARAGLPYIVPEMREDDFAFRWASRHQTDELVTWNDLRGTLHNHSTWSDGKQSVADMAAYCQELGLTYFGIADHSKTATYANGLDVERVQQQQVEIDKLNEGFGTTFRIFKGIESDILGDGSLDYDDATLATFDYVVASVHQTLTMSLEKATTRLLRAIENPYTTILGHPTGRLLLAREGYPIDHRAIIDACAEHNVVIEINASPYRLDIDWRWIDYAMQQGVKLSINPDAHDLAGLLDMHYGVAIGRKGGLTKAMTFNTLTLEEMTTFLQQRRERLRTAS